MQYPFKSFDGGVTLARQKSGERVFDINTDGVAHYGLYPDWIEDLRMIAGDEIINDMARGAEAYLQMWERTVGVPRTHCLTPKGGFKATGFRRIRLGHTPQRALFRAGQPLARKRAWRYCVKGKKNRKAKVVSVYTKPARWASSRAPPGCTRARGSGAGPGCLGSGAPSESVAGCACGASAGRARSSSTECGAGACASSPSPRGRWRATGARLRQHLKLAGL